MVNTFFLDLLESSVLDKNLFRKPYKGYEGGGSGGAELPQNIELHPVLTELGSYVG